MGMVIFVLWNGKVRIDVLGYSVRNMEVTSFCR